jgi:eukaryotic-like serine/threonine-protein kinase
MDQKDNQPSSDVEYFPALAGRVVGRFAIRDRIGKGGMGEVYRAEDTKLKRTVAIKRISPKFRDNPIYRSRLMKEARNASVLNDPNITAVYDVFNDGDEYFLVMEFIDGKNLRDYINGAISYDDFETIARQCLKGFAVAHRRGLVHRDVKPENIMVTSDKRVKICDFGLAHLTTPEDVDKATVTQGVLGTPGYMAPEVHLGSVLDPRSDIFSLGLVLFELWTGRRPFNDDAIRQSSTFPAVAPQPTTVRPGLNKAFDKVIQRMLSFSPGDRYANAAEALEDLERPEAPTTERRRLFSRRFLVAALLGVLVIAALIGSRIAKPTVPSDTGAASVLLADIENKTDDSYYDLTVSRLLALAMEQSQYLNVMSRYRVSEALARSNLPAGSNVTLPVALDLAKREGAKFVLSGEVRREAGRLLLSVRATDTKSGKEVKAVTAGFGEPAELPSVVRSLAKEAREFLGEAREQVNRTDVPLEQATTRSTIAWERFSRAIRTESLGTKYLPDATTLVKSAVEIDPDFAMAHAQLAVWQSRLGNLNDSLASIRRAFDLSERVTDREKYTIIGQYHNIRWEFDLALKALRTLTLLYPYDDVGQRYYAQALSNSLSTDDAITAAQKAVALNPQSAINRGTLESLLVLANRNDEALSMVNSLRSAGIQNLDPYEANALLGKHDFVNARRIFENIASQPESQGNYGRLQLAKALIYEGKLDEAASELDSDLTKDLQLRDERLAVQRRTWLGWIRALQGNRAAATNFASALLQAPIGPTNLYQLRATGAMLAEIGQVDLLEQVRERVEYFVQSGFEGSFFTSAIAQIKGDIARARGDKELARRQLDQAALQWVDVLTLWSVARLSEDLGDFQRARDSYREIINRGGEILHFSHFPGLKSLALAGAARCEVALGDREKALKHYDEFFTTLGKYSPELMVVRAARQQRENLRAN